MIIIKSKLAIQKMEIAGKLLSNVFDEISEIIRPGISTLELDYCIEKKLISSGLVARSKGYMGYRHASCISVNEQVVHGVPRKTSVLKSGDLVKVDICASWKNYCADMARCFFVESCKVDAQQLAQVAKEALDEGIKCALPRNRLSDISAAIQNKIEKHGFGIIRDFAGHGIGKEMHEDPEILNYVSGKEDSPILRSGMTLAIEPMITLGSYEVVVLKDGWTVETKDKKLAAHVEDTILITDNGPKILTRLES